MNANTVCPAEKVVISKGKCSLHNMASLLSIKVPIRKLVNKFNKSTIQFI